MEQTLSIFDKPDTTPFWTFDMNDEVPLLKSNEPMVAYDCPDGFDFETFMGNAHTDFAALSMVDNYGAIGQHDKMMTS